MPMKNHKALNRKDESSKRLTLHTYQEKHEKKKNNQKEGEWKPTTEKPKLKFETRNNIPSPQNIHKEKHYPNLEWQTWRNRELPETQLAMKMQQGEKTKKEKETTQNQQTVEPSSSYENNIKVRSPKTRSWKPRRAGTINGKPTTRKTT